MGRRRLFWSSHIHFDLFCIYLDICVAILRCYLFLPHFLHGRFSASGLISKTLGGREVAPKVYLQNVGSHQPGVSVIQLSEDLPVDHPLGPWGIHNKIHMKIDFPISGGERHPN